MKRKLLKFIAFLLIVVGCFSCQTTNTSEYIILEGAIKSTIPDDDVIAFFERYLPRPKPSIPLECFFFNHEDKEDKCVMINSIDEFREAFSCSSVMLPVIDFKSYTLIIGQHEIGNTCGYLIEQEIVVESEELVLNINVTCPSWALGVVGTLYYWGIYPKIESKSISVNVIFSW